MTFPSGDYEQDCKLLGKEFTDAAMSSGMTYLVDMTHYPVKLTIISVDKTKPLE